MVIGGLWHGKDLVKIISKKNIMDFIKYIVFSMVIVNTIKILINFKKINFIFVIIFEMVFNEKKKIIQNFAKE